MLYIADLQGYNRSTNLQLPSCQNSRPSIRCNPTLSISISKWSSERVYNRIHINIYTSVYNNRLSRTKCAIYVSPKYPISYLIAYAQRSLSLEITAKRRHCPPNGSKSGQLRYETFQYGSIYTNVIGFSSGSCRWS